MKGSFYQWLESIQCLCSHCCICPCYPVPRCRTMIKSEDDAALVVVFSCVWAESRLSPLLMKAWGSRQKDRGWTHSSVWPSPPSRDRPFVPLSQTSPLSLSRVSVEMTYTHASCSLIGSVSGSSLSVIPTFIQAARWLQWLRGFGCDDGICWPSFGFRNPETFENDGCINSASVMLTYF